MTLCARVGGLALSVAVACCGHAGARVLQIDDTRRIVTLQEPAISPDGRRVAFLAVTADYARAAYRHSLFTIDVGTGAKQRIADGADVAVPRWSPDGRALGYLMRVPPENHLQLVVAAVGRSPRVVTHAANDVNDFAWSPDGATIAFSAYDPARTEDFFEPGDGDYTQTAPVPPVHLWLVPASREGRARRLTAGNWTVAPTDPGGIFTSEFAWSADGRSLYFTRVESTNPGADEYTTIRRLSLATGAIAKVTKHAAFETAPLPGRDALAYLYPFDGDYLAESVVHVVRDGSDVEMTRTLDRNVGGATWMSDGRTLLICGDDGPHSHAWLVHAGGRIEAVPLGTLDIGCDSASSSTFDAGIVASAAKSGGVAFVATDAQHAPELYYVPSIGAAPRRLTHFNDWLQSREIGRMTPFRWTGPGGRTEDGVVTFPPGATIHRRYPLVVFPHGGPGLASIDTFVPEAWPEAQLIASRGYVVFQPNYRGSDDLGNAYMIAIERDTVRGPSDDIMSGVAAVEKLPMVDASRVAVCGWSYGGLLTSWLVSHYHDWKAAVSGAAVNDETEEYNLSVTNVQNRYYLGARPSVGDGAALYVKESPLTYAADITTPMLIWSTTGDPVVPTTMSYSMYHALKDNGRRVKFVEFVAPTHGPSNPRNMEEITGQWLDWFAHYLK